SIDGILYISTAIGTVTNANFGLDQLPVANPASACYSNPGNTATVAVPLLTGNDAEDAGLGSGSTIVITSLATNGTLYYNGILVSLLQVIHNYNPALLAFDPNDGGLAAVFNYAFIDAAGMQGLDASVTLYVNQLVTHPQSVCSPGRIDLTSPVVTEGSSFYGTVAFTYWMNATATIPMPNPTTAGNGTYYIKATTSTGCIVIKPVTVTINPLPTMFNVLGGGGYCAGGEGREIILSGSQPGVLYTLWFDCCNQIGIGVMGWGPPISFGFHTLPGLYTIYGENITTHCTNKMNNCVYIWINEPLPVSISVVASANPVDAGTLVNFTATPTNGGTTPSYQWKVNGLAVGTNSPAFTYTPLNDDEVTCTLTSNEYCVSGNPATGTVIMTVHGVTTNIIVAGIIVNGQSKCYNATQTLTVAGNGKTFTVQGGGSAVMVAGQNIIYLPGTSVLHGGYMHGYISTDNSYCGQMAPSIPAVVSGVETPALNLQQTMFTLYPNPTTGNFTVEQKSGKVYGKILVEVYAMHGERVMTGAMIGENKHEFWISELQHGLYFVKITADNYVETFKLVKTRH
ncbi:MAG: T9SS type A sorting domain-containing protein, partial [Bacteroidetes bacterium]|nr:T9SS type A sorting domain-containing protein [Bacteroidota bacterium]